MSSVLFMFVYRLFSLFRLCYIYIGTLHLGPWFVADKDPTSNTLYVTNNLLIIEKPRIEFTLNHMNWISNEPPLELSQPPYTMKLRLKLRHGSTFTDGEVTLKDQSSTQSTTTSSSSSTPTTTTPPTTTTTIPTTPTTTIPTTTKTMQSVLGSDVENTRNSFHNWKWNSSTTLHVKLVAKDKGIACGQFAGRFITIITVVCKLTVYKFIYLLLIFFY